MNALRAAQKPTDLDGLAANRGRNDPMAIDWVPPARLWQAKSNPRRFSARDTKKAEAIVRKHGLPIPLIATADGCVLHGFLSVIAARKIGLEQVPVFYVDHLSEPEQKMLSLALDRYHELGQFDRKMLGEMFLELELEIPEIDLDSIGFDQTEFDLSIGAATSGHDAEEVPPVQGGPAVTRPGDLWILGEHRVGCGDAIDPTFYAQVLGDRSASMVFTDPPYGCKISGFVSTRGHREFVQGSGDLDDVQLNAFFQNWCGQLAAHAKPGALVYLCIDWRSLHSLMHAATPVFGPLVNMAVWVKDRAGMGSFLRSQHELVLIYKAPGAPHRNNVELGRHGRHRSNVWNYPSAKTFSQNGAEGDLLSEHPTPKPKDMIADAIMDSTKRGDIILDPFLGSGSTLIAAEQAGRVCAAMDLDPLYVDLAVRRWQAWTGKQAVHAESGRPFDDVAAENVSSDQMEETVDG